MTSSTGSSPAFASGNETAHGTLAGRTGSGPGQGGVFIGMDEAGYGPNLGPLVIAVTRWRTPAAPHQCEFYRLLSQIVSAKDTQRGQCLHLADSKLVNVGKNGFRSLETSALALLSCLGWKLDRSEDLWGLLQCGSVPAPPWYAEPFALPMLASVSQIRTLSKQLQDCMARADIELLGVSADLVAEDRFNDLVDANGNKGLTLSRLAFGLLRSCWDPQGSQPTIFVGDKHGGRNRYDELLSEVLDGELIFRLEEGQQLSRYRIGASELRFQVGGEEHLPVACASIVAKYLRELAMRQFNQFWSRHCPDVKGTLGYPSDARRFREAVESRRLELEIADRLFWRVK